MNTKNNNIIICNVNIKNKLPQNIYNRSEMSRVFLFLSLSYEGATAKGYTDFNPSKLKYKVGRKSLVPNTPYKHCI